MKGRPPITHALTLAVMAMLSSARASHARDQGVNVQPVARRHEQDDIVEDLPEPPPPFLQAAEQAPPPISQPLPPGRGQHWDDEADFGTARRSAQQVASDSLMHRNGALILLALGGPPNEPTEAAA